MRVPRVIGAIFVVAACAATRLAGQTADVIVNDRVAVAPGLLDLVLMAALLVSGSLAIVSARPLGQALNDAAASLFPIIYVGVPLGALVWVGELDGPSTLVPLMAVIVVSDSAQYFTGRALGRRPLSPTISPKKTVEGAIGGLVFGTLAMMVGGRWIFDSPVWVLGLVGATLAILGMIGDLFESLLKRSAGLKDSGSLIPGHGGILDRIDSWLFAAPAYYAFVRWFAVLRT